MFGLAHTTHPETEQSVSVHKGLDELSDPWHNLGVYHEFQLVAVNLGILLGTGLD